MRIMLTRVRAVVTTVTLLTGLAIPAVVSPAIAVPAATAVPVASAVPAASDGRAAADGSIAAAARVPHYNHVTVIMDNNHDYGSILHNTFAPTINRLARQYGLASKYYTTSDPVVGNIMALLAGNNFGVSSASPYWDQQLHNSSLLSQLDAAHLTWKEYAQGMPYPGYLGDCYPGELPPNRFAVQPDPVQQPS
jgi:hypothetical protein